MPDTQMAAADFAAVVIKTNDTIIIGAGIAGAMPTLPAIEAKSLRLSLRNRQRCVDGTCYWNRYPCAR